MKGIDDNLDDDLERKDQPSSIRSLKELSDEELDALSARLADEKSSRDIIRSIKASDPEEKPELERLDEARIGLFILDALDIPLASKLASRHLPRGEDNADYLQYRASVFNWGQQTGGDTELVYGRVRRIAGKGILVDWSRMTLEAKNLKNEAANLLKRAAKPIVSGLVAERLKLCAEEMQAEAESRNNLLARRGFESARISLAQRDFVVDCIEIVRLLQSDMEIHSKRDPDPTLAKAGPGAGFPQFVDGVIDQLYGDAHIPKDWERATKRAITYWRGRQKAPS